MAPSSLPQFQVPRPRPTDDSYNLTLSQIQENQDQVRTDQSALGVSAQVQQQQAVAAQSGRSRSSFSISVLPEATVARIRDLDDLFLGVRAPRPIPANSSAQANYATPEALKQTKGNHHSLPLNQTAGPRSGSQGSDQQQLMGQKVTQSIPGRNRSHSTPNKKLIIPRNAGQCSGEKHLYGRAEDAIRQITRISPASQTTYTPKAKLEHSNIDQFLLRASSSGPQVQSRFEPNGAARPAASWVQGQKTAEVRPPPAKHARNNAAPNLRQDTSSHTGIRVTGQQIAQKAAPRESLTRPLRPFTLAGDEIMFSQGELKPDSSISYSTSLLPLPDIEFQEGLFKLEGPQGKKGRLTFLISGSISSGKSTLAYLLAAVFEGTAGENSTVETSKGKEKAKDAGITKVITIHQEEYYRLHKEIPRVKWSEPYPYLFTWERVTTPNNFGQDPLASVREAGWENEKYWEAAYNANVGIDPRKVWKESANPYPQHPLPDPVNITRESIFVDSREACDWNTLGEAVYFGMQQNAGELGTLESEKGRKNVEEAVKQLVNPDLLETLRERVRAWINDETAKNTQHGFDGRALRNGAMREIFILDGPFLFLLNRNSWKRDVFSKGGEKLMQASDVKLFLPTGKIQAGKRRFSRGEFIDPPLGTKLPHETWKEKGYFENIAW